MTWTRAHIIVGTAILATAVWTLHQDATEPLAGTAVVAPMTPCVFEDAGPIDPWHPQATPCLWDATKQGNGEGQSFVLWADPYATDPPENSGDPCLVVIC